MSINVFDGNFMRIATMENYTSLVWTEYYNDVGRFTLVATDTKENIALLKQGNILHQKGKDTAMVILFLKFNSENRTVTAYGKSLIHLLFWKRCLPNIEKITNVEKGLYDIVNNNVRGLPFVTTASLKNYTETYENEVTDNMYEAFQKNTTKVDLGYKMVFDYRVKKYVVTVYKGTDRTQGQTILPPITFSDQNKNLKDLTFTDDMGVFANVAYVKGSGDADKRKTVIVGTATGADRYEIAVDARNIGLKTGETIDTPAYVQRLTDEGVKKLNERIKVFTFTGNVSQEGFRTKYFLGDKVTCKSTWYDVTLNTRIMSYEEVTEDQFTTLKLTFGNPEISLFKEMKINGSS